VLSLSALSPSISFASVHVVGNLARSKTAKPGETFDGVILLKNTGAKSADVHIRQTDYQCYADGRTLYGDPGTSARSNAKWISVTPSHVTVPGNEMVSVNYKVRVPSDAKLVGTYWSLIMVEPAAAPAPEVKGGKDEIAVGVQTVTRFGVQIITEIGTTGNCALKVADKALVNDNGKRALKLDFENTGERDMVPNVSIELYGQNGLSIGKFDAGRGRIFPGGSVRYHADLSAIPIGKYVAMVIADTGDDHVMGAQYELEITN